MNKELSTKALVWLTFFTQNPEAPLNYKFMMDAGLSRSKSIAILKELKDAGYINVRKLGAQRGSMNVLTNHRASTMVSSGWGRASIMVSSDTAVMAVQPIQPIYNSGIASTTNKATNKFLDEVEEESEQVGYEFFESTSSSDDDELLRNRAKHEAKKKAEYEEAREKKAQLRKDLHRSKVDPSSWSCKDVAYEFADRMANIWSIKPFSVTQSRFVQALAVFRKQHDTNGALELEIIDLFFSTLKADKYEDGNHLWRAFLYKAPSLIQSARERVVSVEVRESAIIRDNEQAARKLSIFDEDDDV